MAAVPLIPAVMKLRDLSKLSETFEETEKMPVLFLGHGSPMNAIEDNQFTREFRTMATAIPKPTAILVISAHWETSGTKVTAMEFPRTIHDFGGFPQVLFEQQYPAKGSKELAELTSSLITSTDVRYDYDWGLDHGAWSVLTHLYPEANIPVVQMSIDYTKDAAYHYELAKEIASLRKKGVLVVGSGNMVHNLRRVDWANINTIGHGFDWALEARSKMNDYILNGDHQALINYRSQGTSFDLAIPTPEHYFPLIYTLGLKDDTDDVCLFNDEAMAGSLTMTSVKIG